MPAIVGTVHINSISGIFNIGDVQTISPKNLAKTYAGGGSFNSGDKLTIHNSPSLINVYDSKEFEQITMPNENQILTEG